MHALDQKSPGWRKSSYSTPTANCVEVALAGSATAVRDSKDREGAVLVFSAARWADFLRTLR